MRTRRNVVAALQVGLRRNFNRVIESLFLWAAAGLRLCRVRNGRLAQR